MTLVAHPSGGCAMTGGPLIEAKAKGKSQQAKIKSSPPHLLPFEFCLLPFLIERSA
jgi:hypothetical protein